MRMYTDRFISFTRAGTTDTLRELQDFSDRLRQYNNRLTRSTLFKEALTDFGAISLNGDAESWLRHSSDPYPDVGVDRGTASTVQEISDCGDIVVEESGQEAAMPSPFRLDRVHTQGTNKLKMSFNSDLRGCFLSDPTNSAQTSKRLIPRPLAEFPSHGMYPQLRKERRKTHFGQFNGLNLCAREPPADRGERKKDKVSARART